MSNFLDALRRLLRELRVLTILVVVYLSRGR